jgi:hypothetical protein
MKEKLEEEENEKIEENRGNMVAMAQCKKRHRQTYLVSIHFQSYLCSVVFTKITIALTKYSAATW